MILRLSDLDLADFLENYRKKLEFGEAEKKKAILRSVIEYGVFDGTTLKINPSYQIVAGVNLASPRGCDSIPVLPATTQVTYHYRKITSRPRFSKPRISANEVVGTSTG